MKKALSKIAILLPIVLMALFIIVPLMWMITASLTSPLEALKWPPKLLPKTVTLDNYRAIFRKVDLGQFVFNSAKIAFLATLIQVLSSAMAAYAFSRYSYKWVNVLFFFYLSAMMIPGQVLSIPRFIMMSKLGLINHHEALILPAVFSAMGVFLIRQFMLTISKSYDEAAHIDGASPLYCFMKIILPMAKPAVIVVAIQSFIGNWNDFYGPLIYINSESKMTLPLGLTALRGMLGAGNESVIIASVILTLLAPLLFYIFGQKYMIEGINLGGIKE